jgi:exodeoxyribonuclease VII large subunit
LGRQQEKLLRLSLNLQHLNPHAVLKRGYALVQKKDGAVVQNSGQLDTGDLVDIRFAEGMAEAEVTKLSSSGASQS